jgi:outer membrane protein OmpA-like peptidoglycan-associated protein
MMCRSVWSVPTLGSAAAAIGFPNVLLALCVAALATGCSSGPVSPGASSGGAATGAVAAPGAVVAPTSPTLSSSPPGTLQSTTPGAAAAPQRIAQAQAQAQLAAGQQPPILPLQQALAQATQGLFASVQWPNAAPSTGPSGGTPAGAAAAPGEAKLPLVIDPLIDGNSWMQTKATRAMETAVLQIIKEKQPRFEALPFTSTSLARGPFVFIGTFTPLDAAGKIEGPTEWYRICLALLDLRSGKIIGKGFARASPEGVDSTPLPFFEESPGWSADEATTGYVRTCQGTKVGDAVHPAYWDRVAVAAVVSDAVNAYNSGRYDTALDLYRGALHMPGGRQLRVHNGIYLSASKLKRADDAAQAFGELVDFGLAQKKISVKMLFRPGAAQFIANPALATEYAMWLKQIAGRAGKAPECMLVAGHTSKSGPEPRNQVLSLQRAAAVQQRLVVLNKALAKKLKTAGLGSSQAISGTGTDDARDAVDRRVEFRMQECSAV